MDFEYTEKHVFDFQLSPIITKILFLIQKAGIAYGQFFQFQ